MRIALIRREFVTHLDGVNKFIANLAEGLEILGHDAVVVGWSYRGVRRSDLPTWFREVHGLDREIGVLTLRGPEERDRWVAMMYDWLTKGGRLLRELGTDAAIVNGVVPLTFRPKVAVAHGPLTNVPWVYRAALRALYGTYDYVVCASRASEREYRGITRCDEIVPLPLKLENFRPRPPVRGRTSLST